MTFPLDGTLRISSSSSSRFDRHGQRRMNDQILPLAHCELDPRTTTTHSRSKRETDKNGTKRKRIVLFDAKPPATVPSPSFYALSSSSSRTKGFLLFDLAPLSLSHSASPLNSSSSYEETALDSYAPTTALLAFLDSSSHFISYYPQPIKRG